MCIMTGEAMLGLWGCLKSVLTHGDKVLVIGTGLFGFGFADMAKGIGAQVQTVDFEYDDIIENDKVRDAAIKFKPKLITVVHCETPSGTLNPIKDLGKIAKEVGALLLVDFVASACAVEVNVTEWGIDLGILGTQKALSLLPDLTIITVSNTAWEKIEDIKYVGYDAILPWKKAHEEKLLPYTMSWQSFLALNKACYNILQEGLDNVLIRHNKVAQYCRDRLKQLGIKLYPKKKIIIALQV